ncbi:MAG: hypothetical protein K5694_04705 [Bacilli bacterium]|nr:hypothetical protein [Bacilli bacterium]
MKTKQKLVLGLSVLSALTLAAGVSGTFAWYNATAAATITGINAATSSIETSASTLADQGYHVKVTYNGTLTKVDLTDPNGGAWGVVGGYLRAATVKTAAYASLSTTASDWVVTVHATAGGDALAGGELATALANLHAAGKNYPVSATGGDHVRLTKTNPSSNFATAFGGAGTGNTKIGQTVAVGTVAFNGENNAAVVTLSGTVYYSISGNDDNSVPTAGAAASQDIPSGDETKVTISIAEPA